MKAGKSLQEVLMELKHQSKAKKGYTTPTQGMKLERGNRAFPMGTQTPFATIPLSHRQLVSAPSTPMKYYDLMQKGKPELLMENVNAWLGTRQNSYMACSMDHDAGPTTRALLSERYRRVDNMETVLAVLLLPAGDDGYSVGGYEVTEHRLYLRILNRRLEMEVREGGIVQAGVIISSSKVGLGAASVQPLVYRLACLNGLVVSDYDEGRNHVDRQAKMTEDFTLYPDEILQVEDRTFLLRLRNVAMAAIEENRFAQTVDRLKKAAEIPIKGNVQEAVKLTGRESGVAQEEQDGVFRYLVEGGDFPLYGLTNAVARMSQDADSYNRATVLEWIGQQVMQGRGLYVQEEKSREGRESAVLGQTEEYQ